MIELNVTKPKAGFSSMTIHAKFASGTNFIFKLNRDSFKQLSEANSKMTAFNKWLHKNKENKKFFEEFEAICTKAKTGRELISLLIENN